MNLKNKSPNRRTVILGERLQAHVDNIFPVSFMGSISHLSAVTLLLILDLCAVQHNSQAGDDELSQLRHPLLSEFAQDCNHTMASESVNRYLAESGRMLLFEPLRQDNCGCQLRVSTRLNTGVVMEVLDMKCLPQDVPASEYGWRRGKLFVQHALFAGLVEELFQRMYRTPAATKLLQQLAKPTGNADNWIWLRDEVHKLVKPVDHQSAAASNESAAAALALSLTAHRTPSNHSGHAPVATPAEPACRNTPQDWYEDTSHLQPPPVPARSYRPRCEDCDAHCGNPTEPEK